MARERAESWRSSTNSESARSLNWLTNSRRRAGALARIGACALIFCLPARCAGAQQLDSASPSTPPSWSLEGHLTDGAAWRARVPAHWNGTLLLYSHGYAPELGPPQLAPRGLENWLIAQGYALGASSYARAGWAVAEAIPDQRALLEVFRIQVAKPHRTFAWGDSMGGLVTTALAESAEVPIDGAVSACGSIAGTLAMMNTALDGAFTFVTLQAPEAGIRLDQVGDDRANTARVAPVVAHALDSPAGRAHVALAGVLGGLPTWTEPSVPQPLPDAYEQQLDQMAKAFGAGLFPPRVDQERRAGGSLSWNNGVDYRAALKQTGRWQWVEYFYRKAHLNLERDLERLNATPRLNAQHGAVDYMRSYYAPSAAPHVPLLSIHTLGDGLTSEIFQSGYARAVSRGAAAGRYRAASVAAAGHCSFSPAEYIAALKTVELRVQEGRWSTSPEALNARAEASGLGAGRYVAHHAAPLLRACWSTESRCQGEPAAH